MKLSQWIQFRWVLASAALAILFASPRISSALDVLTIDGRDVGNLAGEGNHGTWHNPPVAFAFAFGSVAADNPTVGPGDPPTATDTDFNYTGTDFGGLGFGIQPDLAFPAATSFAVIELTVNPNNTLPTLVLNLKDRDQIFVPPFSNVEEHQYLLGLGAPGTKTLTMPLATSGFTNNPTPGAPNGPGSTPDFDPLLGLSELQLQYPYSEGCEPGGGCTGAVMDLTIHSIRIVNAVPEPSTIGLCGFVAALGVVARGQRRQIAA